MKNNRKRNRRRKTVRGSVSIYRCGHCRKIHLEIGNMTIELDEENFEIFRDMVNEISLPKSDRSSIWNSKRLYRWKN